MSVKCSACGPMSWRWIWSARAAARQYPICARPSAVARGRLQAGAVDLCRSLQRGLLSRQRSRRVDQRLPVRRWRGRGGARRAARKRPRRVEWQAAGSLHNPAERDALRFEHKDGMLRNILTPQVPRLAARHAAAVLDDVLSRQGMSRADIDTWIWHAGGRKVIEALRETLQLSAVDLGWSSGVLREFGNLSSPSVYFALQAALAGARARLVVDVVVRRRLQLPRRIAQGGVKVRPSTGTRGHDHSAQHRARVVG